MLKFGVISEVDAAKGTARVFFEEDDFVSSWLKVSVPRVFKDQFSFPYEINEHVWCIMDEGWEYGVIGGAIYDEENLPANSEVGVLSWRFRDNSVITYDTVSRTLNLDIKGEITINCEEAKITSTGNIEAECVDAKVTATANIDLEAAVVNIKAVSTNIDGILNVTGAATVAGVLAMGGLAGIAGAPIPGAGVELNVDKITAADDVTAAGKSLKLHTHNSTTPGSPTGPPL